MPATAKFCSSHLITTTHLQDLHLCLGLPVGVYIPGPVYELVEVVEWYVRCGKVKFRSRPGRRRRPVSASDRVQDTSQEQKFVMGKLARKDTGQTIT